MSEVNAIPVRPSNQKASDVAAIISKRFSKSKKVITRISIDNLRSISGRWRIENKFVDLVNEYLDESSMVIVRNTSEFLIIMKNNSEKIAMVEI